MHIAEALVTNEADLRELLNEHVLAQIPNSNDPGELVFSMGEVIFVSRGMIQRLSTTILPPLIASFAKRRALELEQGSNAERCSNEVDMKSANKVKKKAKKDSAKSKLSARHGEHTSFRVVPLSVVVAKVAEDEPELASIHEIHRPISEASPDEEFHLWEPEEANEYLQKYLMRFFFIITNSDHNIILEKIESYQINKNSIKIITVPFSDVPINMYASDCSISFIKPVYSKMSSSPVKVGEILSMGIPLIANAIGDNEKLLVENKFGVLVKDFSEKTFNKIVENIEENINIEPQKIREAALKIFSLEEGVKKYTAVYKSLLG